MKLTDAEAMILAPYEAVLADLYAVQLAAPTFGITVSSVQMRDAVRSAALYIVQAEHAGEPKTTRAKHLEHMLSAVQETFANELKLLDSKPEALDDLLRAGKHFADIATQKFGKPRA